MRQITAFSDAAFLARDFVTGDVVRKAGLHEFTWSPYVGRVIYVNAEQGTVSVQWPWGVEQESPLYLTKDASGDFVPPGIDQSYSTYELSRYSDGEAVVKEDEKWRKSLAASVADEYERRTLPVWREACRQWHSGADEVSAYMALASKMGPEYGDDAVRLTVSNLYGLAGRIAIYWRDKKRRYKVTQQEKDSKKLACPRCRGLLRPRVYRQGRKFLLCKDCGFSIHPKDLT